MKYLRKFAGIAAAACIGSAAGAQRSSPPTIEPPADSTRTIQVQFAASPALGNVLERSCGDCHSYVMRPGWFTRVPPFSSVMSRGAKEGRKVINFAEWSSYSPEQRRAFLVASCADAKTGKMPGGAYLRFRGDARLSSNDVATICTAAEKTP
jgi:hypothetical protein